MALPAPAERTGRAKRLRRTVELLAVTRLITVNILSLIYNVADTSSTTTTSKGTSFVFILLLLSPCASEEGGKSLKSWNNTAFFYIL